MNEQVITRDMVFPKHPMHSSPKNGPFRVSQMMRLRSIEERTFRVQGSSVLNCQRHDPYQDVTDNVTLDGNQYVDLLLVLQSVAIQYGHPLQQRAIELLCNLDI